MGAALMAETSRRPANWMTDERLDEHLEAWGRSERGEGDDMAPTFSVTVGVGLSTGYRSKTFEEKVGKEVDRWVMEHLNAIIEGDLTFPQRHALSNRYVRAVYRLRVDYRESLSSAREVVRRGLMSRGVI